MSFKGPGSSSMYVAHHSLFSSRVTYKESPPMSGGFPMGQGSRTCLGLTIIWYLDAESGASYRKCSCSFSVSGGGAQASLNLTHIPGDS